MNGLWAHIASYLAHAHEVAQLQLSGFGRLQLRLRVGDALLQSAALLFYRAALAEVLPLCVWADGGVISQHLSCDTTLENAVQELFQKMAESLQQIERHMTAS